MLIQLPINFQIKNPLPGTPVHFKRLGLLGDSVDVTDEETNLNALMQTALFKVVFMPFAYVVDLFRWDLYQGKVDESQINCHWVKLRAKIQGNTKGT